MKRVLINDMPWQEIQRHYNDGLSLRDLQEKFKISFKTFQKAKALNLFVPRDLSSAMKVNLSKNPRDYADVRSKRPALINYRADCAFNFNLSDYPDEFDFTLIESYGWYKPKNRGNNLTGVSRDHAVSVRYGFDNNLPAEHLAHPANCVLMQHGKNVSKGKHITMSYEELLKRIDAWDRKYNLGD
jgi:hypothetical protein